MLGFISKSKHNQLLAELEHERNKSKSLENNLERLEEKIQKINKEREIIIQDAKNEYDKIIEKANLAAKEQIASYIPKILEEEKKFEEIQEKRNALLSDAKKESVRIIQGAKKEYDRIIEKANLAAKEQIASYIPKILEKEKELEDLSDKLKTEKNKIASLEIDIDINENVSTIYNYESLVNGPLSDEIKEKLDGILKKHKALIRSKSSYTIEENITFNDSLSKGVARQNRLAKFLVVTFNAEVNNLISNVTMRNFTSSVKKIEKWFERVNKAGADDYVVLNRELLNIRLEELRIFFEYKLKREIEQEEQRYIQDSIREENKVKKEIEQFINNRELEEKKLQRDIKDATEEIKLASESEIYKLHEKIDSLKRKLEIASSEKERAISMAQLTRSGNVYIISNKGSFGEGVYKIGMTRRLDPMERVRELGNASVPFFYDVHAIIPSDDAPSLEKKLHDKFSKKRVNKVNHRREFFKVSIGEIEEAIKELIEDDVEIIKTVKSEQYEDSLFLGKEHITQ